MGDLSKAKLESDFEIFNKQIEKLTADAINNIREKADALKEEVASKGKAIELALKEKDKK